MSIWCNWEEIGYDVDPPHLAEMGVEYVKLGDHPDPFVAERGEVLSYAEGFSNHYPTRDREYEQRANVNINHIPAWCVPGHRDDFSDRLIGEWTRLDIFTAEHDFHQGGKPNGQYISASVVMDEAAARALAADLLEWADRPKAYPVAEPCSGGSP